MLHMPEVFMEEIMARAISERPQEICGLVFGPTVLGKGEWLLAHITNTSKAPEHFFRMDDAELVAAFSEAMDFGSELRAVFHSHPNGPLEPSRADMNWAAYDVPTLIVAPDRAQYAAWRSLAGVTTQRMEVLLGRKPFQWYLRQAGPQNEAVMMFRNENGL